MAPLVAQIPSRYDLRTLLALQRTPLSVGYMRHLHVQTPNQKYALKFLVHLLRTSCFRRQSS